MEDDDDEDQADRGLHQVQHHPALLHEQHVADQDTDAGHAELREHGHGQRRALAAHMQPGLNPLFVGFYVFLEFAREKFAHLRVETVHVGNQRQQSHQHQQQDG